MTENSTLPLSSTVYLCDKDRFIQTKGYRGTLTLDADKISFKSESEASSFEVPLQNIIEADLTNIKSKWQFILRTSTGLYVIALYKPKKFIWALLRMFYPAVVMGILVAKWQVEGMSNASKWKQALIGALRSEQVKQRTELRLVRTLLIGIFIPLVLLVIFIVSLKIFL